MPNKTVREMNDRERKHFSLAGKVFHTTMLVSLLLCLVALAIGLGLYTYALTNQYISSAYSMSQTAEMILNKVVDTAPLTEEVMQEYRALSEEDLMALETDPAAYRKHFEKFTHRKDYETIYSVLYDLVQSSDADFLYLGVYDRATKRLIYIVDSDDDPQTQCQTGDWYAVDDKELDAFLDWDGKTMRSNIGDTDRYGWMCTSGVPIGLGNSECQAFILADVTLAALFGGVRTFLLQYVVTMVIVTLLMGIYLTGRMKKTIVDPIGEIAEAAVNYVKGKRAGNRDPGHFSNLMIRTGDEVENLSLTMADMERELCEYEDDLKRVTAEKERIHTELELATRIQMDMLPNIFPPFPDRKEFDIYALMDPAREVGGDFFDFIMLDDDHVYIVVADVSGKGVPAALFMMASKIILANNATQIKSPAEILKKTNDAICSNNREEMFVTVWLGILEISTGKIIASNAGHEYPAVMHSGGEYELLKDKHGLVIGGMEGAEYTDYELQLEPGSRLFIYSDGVPEATNADKEMFGTDRLITALNEARGLDLEQMLNQVKGTVDGFVGEEEQFDDMTMLCLEYRGNSSK